MKWQIRHDATWLTDEELVCDFCKKTLSVKNPIMIEMFDGEHLETKCYKNPCNWVRNGKQIVKDYWVRLIEYRGDCHSWTIDEDGRMTEHITFREGMCDCKSPIPYEHENSDRSCQYCYRAIRSILPRSFESEK